LEEAPVALPVPIARFQEDTVAGFFRQALGLALLRHKLLEKLAGLSKSIQHLARRQRKELMRLALFRPLGAQVPVNARLASRGGGVLGFDVIEQCEGVRIAGGKLLDPSLQLAARPSELEEVFVAASEHVDKSHGVLLFDLSCLP